MSIPKKTKKGTNDPFKVLERRFMGVKVFAGGKAQPCAMALYEEHLANGSTRVRRGYPVHGTVTSGHLNAKTKREKEWVELSYRPDLLCVIEAAATLLLPIEAACQSLDNAQGMPELRWGGE